MQGAIAYYRVSTQRQGRSGLGLEAQRAAVARFAEVPTRSNAGLSLPQHWPQRAAPRPMVYKQRDMSWVV